MNIRDSFGNLLDSNQSALAAFRLYMERSPASCETPRRSVCVACHGLWSQLYVVTLICVSSGRDSITRSGLFSFRLERAGKLGSDAVWRDWLTISGLVPDADLMSVRGLSNCIRESMFVSSILMSRCMIA